MMTRIKTIALWALIITGVVGALYWYWKLAICIALMGLTGLLPPNAKPPRWPGT